MDHSEFFTPPTLKREYINFNLVSRSGFNAIYSAEREGKKFAVKALMEEYRGELLYESLLRKEFEIGYQLDHHNICHTYSFEQLPQVGNAIVMEWVDGRTLDKYIAEKRHEAGELERVVEQICESLIYAHKRQIVHRDLKPQNIIITYNGDNVKLLDFGLSDTDYHTILKEPAGSRRYASPELQQGGKVDSRADVYSLGVIINELFEGQRLRKVSKIVTRATTYYPQGRYPDVQSIVVAMRGDSPKTLYPILIAIVVAIGYLLYATSHNAPTSIESLIPSAEVDGVSVEEFERRQTLSSRFYQEINNSYLALMNDDIYKMNCSTKEMPNFDKLSQAQLATYRGMLDSMMVEIKGSSLYATALRNMSSHNNELFTLMRNNFPALFWLNTEQLYQASKDSLAIELKQLPKPKIAPNFHEMSYEQQQVEGERYNKAVNEYKSSTIKVWAVAYRKSRGLSPIDADLLGYYDL